MHPSGPVKPNMCEFDAAARRHQYRQGVRTAVDFRSRLNRAGAFPHNLANSIGLAMSSRLSTAGIDVRRPVAVLNATARSVGDTRSRYQEILVSGDLEVVMTWDRLGSPYAVDMPAEKRPTQKHEMYSMFIDAEDASIELNGRALRGTVSKRNFDGGKKSSAFLAFSESWMEMP